MAHPIGTVWSAYAVFSGTATSITATLYVNGVLDAVTPTLGTPVAIAGQTVQPVSVPTTGRAHGDLMELRVSGTVAAKTEEHRAYLPLVLWSLLDAGGVRTAIGMAAADLDDQLVGISSAMASLDVQDSVEAGLLAYTAARTGDEMQLEEATVATIRSGLATDGGEMTLTENEREAVVAALVASESIRTIVALARGRITRIGNTYTYYDSDGETPLFVFTLAENEREVNE